MTFPVEGFSQGFPVYAAFLFGLLGFAGGAAFFTALHVNVGLYLKAGAVGRAVGLHLARLTGAAALFTAAALQGFWPLIATLAGFVLARVLMMRIVARRQA